MSNTNETIHQEMRRKSVARKAYQAKIQDLVNQVDELTDEPNCYSVRDALNEIENDLRLKANGEISRIKCALEATISEVRQIVNKKYE